MKATISVLLLLNACSALSAMEQNIVPSISPSETVKMHVPPTLLLSDKEISELFSERKEPWIYREAENHTLFSLTEAMESLPEMENKELFSEPKKPWIYMGAENLTLLSLTEAMRLLSETENKENK
jgi:uncharacterized Fe-S cluster protein YjdI